MNFFTAKVSVKVDDSKLPAQLARVKSITLRTVDKIKASFAGMATSFKKAFDKMVRVAKYALVGIAAALGLATRAAMKQEDALFLLNSALKISGEYTEQLEARFKEFASRIQQVTIYGDEFVLSLMQQQKSLGVVASSLEEGAKMAIGLATATGMGIESMSRYVALAMQGEFTMLRRYIPALRTTTDLTEQLAIVTKFAADGFLLAEQRAMTASGGLLQMKNALGDVAEIIGDALLPAIKDTTKAIKEWAERNQERIGVWSKEVVRYIGLVKDGFMDYVNYLRRDWRAALDSALKVAVVLLKGFWQTSVVIMKMAGRMSGEAFVAGFGEPIVKFADEWLAKSWWERLKDPVGSAKYAIFGGMAETIRQYNKQVGADTVKETQATWDKIKEIVSSSAAEIQVIMEGMEPKRTLQQQYDIAVIKQRILDIDRERAEIAKVIFELQTPQADPASFAVGNMADSFDKTGDKIQTQISAWEQGVEDFGWQMETSIHYALENTMRDFKNWKDHLLRFFEEIYWAAIRIAFIEPLAKSVAGAFTGALTGFAPTLLPAGTPSGLPPGAPGSRPGLKDGGYVEKTGWAKVHKGETYSGVGGAGGLDVRIYNESGVKLEIAEAEESDALDQRILSVTLAAAKTNGGYRRGIKKIRR